MVNVDTEHLSDYLCISADKLAGKGVASVRSRVVNLNTLSPDITTGTLKKALINAFCEVYGKATEISAPDETQTSPLQEKFASDDWIFGTFKHFDVQVSNRFPWGGVEVCIAIHDAKIAAMKIYTDALETEIFERITNALIGVDYSFVELAKRLSPFDDPLTREIENLMKEKLF